MSDTYSVDLNDYSQGPHWLSPLGRVNRDAIRAKHRANYLANKVYEKTPARPETMAKLRATKARIEKANLTKLVRVWNGAIAILDRSEVQLRDLIERELVDVAGMNGIRYGEAMAATDKLMKKVAIIRTRAIKRAFRYLRSKLGNKDIQGSSLAAWASHISAADINRLDKVIRNGILGGLENIEIARAVVGSMKLRGIDGATEVTRHHISQLARAALKSSRRKK